MLASIKNDIGFKNAKFYYIFPEYKAPNVIFSDEHEVTLEDISRNFELNEENQNNNFVENDVLNQIVLDDKSLVKFFVNSYLVEISDNETLSDVKYVTFTNYRSSEYQIETIIKSDKVVKKPITPRSVKHIENIIDNMKYFPKEGVKLLDTPKDKFIESKFINGKRLDEEILKSSNI